MGNEYKGPRFLDYYFIRFMQETSLFKVPLLENNMTVFKAENLAISGQHYRNFALLAY